MEHFRTTEADPALATAAIDVLSEAALASSRDYRDNIEHSRPQGFSTGEEYRARLAVMHRSMSEGVINMISEHFAMTIGEGYAMALRADRLLTSVGSDVQRALADANYSLYFSNRTMASGADIPATSLHDIIESETEEQMPHLTRTNLAIGQLVSHIAGRANGSVAIIDQGSGTGATLAAIIAGLQDNEAVYASRLSITSIESNPDFCDILGQFGVSALAKLSKIYPGFERIVAKGPKDIEHVGEDRTISFVDGSIPDVMSTLNGKDYTLGKDDLSVVTANYVWHRLTTAAKEHIIQGMPLNSIFIIADLIKNASAVNRRFFNFGNNGPLNCGNIGLRNLFQDNNFVVREIAKQGPRGLIHPSLAEKISNESTNDGRLWVAYRGDAAKRTLFAD